MNLRHAIASQIKVAFNGISNLLEFKKIGVFPLMVVMTLVASMPMAIVVAFVLQRNIELERDDALKTLLRVSENSAESADLNLTEHITVLTTLAESNEAQKLNFGAMQTSVKRILKTNSKISSIALLDPRFNIIFSESSSQTPYSADLRSNTAAKWVLEQHSPSISEPLKDNKNSPVSAYIGVPVRNEDNEVYCLLARVDANFLEDMLDKKGVS